MMQLRFKSRFFALLLAGILACGSISYPVNAETTNAQPKGTQETSAGEKADKEEVQNDVDDSKKNESENVKEDDNKKEEDGNVTEETSEERPEETTTEDEKKNGVDDETEEKKDEVNTTEEDTKNDTETAPEEKTTASQPTAAPDLNSNLPANGAAPSSETTTENPTEPTEPTEPGTGGETQPAEPTDISNTEYFSVSWKTVQDYTYTGKAITPEVVVVEKERKVTVTNDQGVAEEETIPEKTWVKDKDYTAVYETNINAGAASVTITPKDTTNYKGSVKLTFNIKPKNINDFDVSMEGKDKVYKGRSLSADVNMYYNGMKMERSKDYRVQNYTNNTNVGTATGIVTGIGNYTGQRTMTFKISAQSIRDENLVTITPDLSEKSYKFNGKYRTPSVTLKFKIVGEDNKVVGSYTLRKDVDYTITYEDNKKVGMATVMIIGKGNFGSSYVTNFKIRPQPTILKKLEKSKKSLKATWAARDKQVTGYVVMCSTKKDFSSNVKKAKVKKKITKKTFKNLKSKKKYFVRVRTYKNVDGTTYYSNWSNVMKIKTK